MRLVTTDPAARACPACGTFATRVKERTVTRPRDLAHGGGKVRIRWHKRRWQCREDACERGSFTEQIPQIPARMRLTERLRTACGQAVADGGRTVVQTGRDLGPSWPVVMRATRTYAERHLPAAPPATEAIGIDETRRGKPVWKQNPDTEKWELVADAWHIGFVDAIGGRGLFGQVEGRNADSVADWLSAQPAAWREQCATSPSTCAPPSAPRSTAPCPRPSSSTASTSCNSPSATSPTCADASPGNSTAAGPAASPIHEPWLRW